MQQTYSFGSSLMAGLASLFLLAACAQTDSPTAPATAETTPSDSTLLELPLDLDVAEEEAQEARMIVTERPATSTRAKGVNFGWKKNEVIKPVYVHFTQGSKRAVATGQLTILDLPKGSGAYKAKLTVNFPTGINGAMNASGFTSGAISMAAAFGVSSVSPQGIAAVHDQEAHLEGEAGFNPPMYLPPTTLSVVRNAKTGRLEPSGGGTFRLFGLLLRLRIANNANMRYYPVLLSINEGALESSANFNILTGARTAGRPSSSKGVKALFGARFVPSRQARNFYIWAYGQQRTATSAAYLYSSASWPNADIRKNISLSAVPENHRVYDLPLSPRPQNGDLIFTEILHRGNGANLTATAFELYNPTDATINLSQYSIERTSNGQTTSASLGSSMVAKQLYSQTGSWTLTLPPRKSIVIVGQGQTLGPDFSRDLFSKEKRPGLQFVVNYPNNQDAFKGINVAQKRTTSWAIKKGGTVIDALFTDGMAVPGGVTLMRKPGRDIPRKKMQTGSNTDWVTREAKEQYDWGLRFGYYYDEARAGGNFRGAHWILDPGTLTSYDNYTDNSVVGFLNRAPLLHRTSYSWGDRFDGANTRAAAPYYTPPKWWTKKMAETADR